MELPPRRSLRTCLAVATAGVLSLSCPPQRQSEPAAELPPAALALSPPARTVLQRADLGVERSLAPGALDLYRLDLTAGVLLHVELDQRGRDVITQLLEPDGQPLLEVDSHTGNRAPEQLVAVTRVAGTHTLAVRAFTGGSTTGGYLARIVAERPANPRDRRQAAAESAFATAYALVESSPPGQAPAAAVASYEAALAGFATLGLAHRQAVTFYELGRLHSRAGRHHRAIDGFARSLPLLQAPADRRARAIALNELALAWGAVGAPAAQERALLDALPLFHASGDRHNQATALHNLGRLASRRGRPLEALARLTQAAELQRQLGAARDLAQTLNVTGEVYAGVGEPELALDHHRQALELLDPHADPALYAETLSFLGSTQLAAGNLEGAAAAYAEALATHQARGDEVAQATARIGLGLVAERRGEPQQALELYQQGLAVLQTQEALEPRAITLNNLAWLYFHLGATARALELHQQALDLFRRLGNPEAEATSLLGLARAQRRLGHTAAALESAAAALARIERVLASGQVPAAENALHLPYLAARQGYFDLYVELLMERHRHQPAAGHDALALAASERARARQLLDTLAQKSAMAAPQLALAGVQRLLDGDTLLLAYHLGEERSYLWAVSRDGLASYPLPPRAEVEQRARRAWELLGKSHRITHRVPAERALAALADVLLAPVATRLAGQRLAIVAGGALEYVPFAALPLPSQPRRRLVEEHEIVHLPSAAVLAVLRRQSRDRDPPAGLLALLADPVFDPGDPRLAGRPTAPAVPELGLPSLRRLPHSRREAEAILALAGGRGPVLAALDFNARRQLATSGQLAGYRILHFATHGVLHAEHPELSALMLSRYQADGRPQEGRLALHEIRDLHLPADLVVLSACRTALGREVRGEGLLGLPRGFLHAGATRVLVSLWKVQDEGTAELMARFYRHLLIEHQPPAAALRAAQRSMLAEPRYAPYHWAGFVLQGDWR